MASLRSAFRLAPRAQFVRPAPVSRLVGQRGYAAVITSPATTSKPIAGAEQGITEPYPLEDDPNMNGNYPDPSLTSSLPMKRQHRDPYGEWWDPIEKRNYGEPVHEDNDILGVFSPDDYTHFTSRWEFALWGMVITTFSGVCYAIYQVYPDRPAVMQTYEGGLERELGGPLARPARASADQPSPLDRSSV